MNFKKFSIVMIIFLVALVGVNPVYANQRFTDVPSSHTASEEISYLVNQGIIKGYTEKGKAIFKPNASVTRGQAAKMVIVATKNQPIKVQKSSFKDIKVGTELSGYVESAVKLGFFSEHAKGEFGPNIPLTRAEMSKVLALAFKLDTEQNAKLAVPFTDVSTSNKHYPYIATVYYNGIAQGGGSKFNANEPVKRSQFASFVARAKSDKYRLDLPVQGVHIPDNAQAIAKVNVGVNNLNVRASATTNESNVLGKVNQGTSLNVFEVQKSWYKVAYNGRYAYVSKDYTAPLDEGGNVLDKVQQQVKAKGDIQLYAKRDVNGKVLKNLNDQTVIDVYGTVGNWHSTVIDGLPAYVRISQISSLEEEPKPAPKPEPKPEVKPEPKPEPKPEVKPEPKPPVVAEEKPVAVKPPANVVVEEEKPVEEPTEKPTPEPVATEPTKLLTDTIGKVTVNGLNIRKSASGSSDSLGKVDRGIFVEVHSISGSWAKVKVNGIEGYINKTYLQLINQKGTAVKDRIIILDPGHGGKDGGASRNGVHEKEVVLKVSKLVKEKLEKDGAIVKMTREGDTYPSLPDRVQYAKNQYGEVFVSIHANAATSESAKGTETFHSIQANDNAKEDSVLAAAINREIVKNAKMYDRGVKRADYAVIRGLVMPAVLVELGFLSNTEDRNKLADDAYVEIYAQSIYNGIVEYYSK